MLGYSHYLRNTPNIFEILQQRIFDMRPVPLNLTHNHSSNKCYWTKRYAQGIIQKTTYLKNKNGLYRFKREDFGKLIWHGFLIANSADCQGIEQF